MGKVWSFIVNMSPWLLLVLPVQIVLSELTTTPHLALGQIVLAFVLLLYRTSSKNELVVRSGVLVLYSILLGIIAENRTYDVTVTLHLTWLLLIVYALAATQVVSIDDSSSSADTKNGLDWRWVVSFVSVFAVALTLRLTNYQSLPVFGGDEANAALYGIALRDGVVQNLFGSGWYEFPALWFAIPAFTHTILPDGMLAVRIHSIIIGSLTCVALVWAIKPIVPSWLAPLAGIVLAFFGVHVFFSQIGLNNIYDGFFLTLMLGLLVRQGEQLSAARWGMLGVVIGLALYGYTSARLLPIIFGVWVLMRIWSARPQWQDYLRGFAVVALIAGVVAVPLLVHYYFRPDNMVAPLVRTSFFSQNAEGLTLFARIERDTGRSMWGQLQDHFVASVSALTVGEATGWYKFSRGLTGAMFTIPLLIGMIYAFVVRQALMMRLVVVSMLLYLVMSMLSHPIGAGQRLVTVMPLIAILVVNGFVVIDVLLRRTLPAWQAVLLVAGIVALGSYANYDAYFRQFLWYEGGVGDGNSRTVDFYGQHVRTLPAGTVVDVYISGDFQLNTNAAINYHSRHLDYLQVTDTVSPRSNAQVIVVPIGHQMPADIPPDFVRSTFILKPSDETLMTIAYHPDLRPYLDNVDVVRIYPPRFGE